MKSNYKRLGDYIEPCDLLNDKEELTLLQGISNEKYFQGCKSNTNDIDLSRYRICRKGWFAYNRATTRNGDKISIAYRDEQDCLVSPSYKCFRIKDETLLNPYYLLLWFKRPQFDRYARFKSHGSAHEYFEYEEMCDVELPIPDIEEQKKIVQSYKVIENRISILRQINDNLVETAQTLFTSWFIDFEPFEHSFDEDGNAELPLGWEYSTLDICVDFLNGYAFKSEDLIDEPIPDSFDVFKMGHIKKGGGLNYSGTKSWIPRDYCQGLDRFILRYGDILMCMTDMKENVALLGHTAFMDIENKYIVNQRVGLLRPNYYNSISPYHLYLLTNNVIFLRDLRKNAHIGVQVNLSKEDIVNSRIVLAPAEINKQFTKKVEPLFTMIFKHNAEIMKLEQLAFSLQSQLSH